MADRTAQKLHAQRLASKAGGTGFQPDPALMSSLGLSLDDFEILMAALGFRTGKGGFAFAPERKARQRRKPQAPAVNSANPFANLSALLAANGETRS